MVSRSSGRVVIPWVPTSEEARSYTICSCFNRATLPQWKHQACEFQRHRDSVQSSLSISSSKIRLAGGLPFTPVGRDPDGGPFGLVFPSRVICREPRRRNISKVTLKRKVPCATWMSSHSTEEDVGGCGKETCVRFRHKVCGRLSAEDLK